VTLLGVSRAQPVAIDNEAVHLPAAPDRRIGQQAETPEVNLELVAGLPVGDPDRRGAAPEAELGHRVPVQGPVRVRVPLDTVPRGVGASGQMVFAMYAGSWAAASVAPVFVAMTKSPLAPDPYHREHRDCREPDDGPHSDRRRARP
jgi:hypothetical protein